MSERWPFAGDDVSFSTSYLRMNVKKCRVFFCVPLPSPSLINAHDNNKKKKKQAGFGSVEIQAGKAPTIGYFQGSLC